MKHKKYFVLGLISLCLLCGVLLYSCIAAPTNTPCTPLEYPNGNKLDVEATKIYTFETNDAYADVVAFYEVRLNPESPPEDSHGPIIWDAYSIRNEGVLFECVSLLDDGFTLETGCIYVSEKSGKRAITLAWTYSGQAESCDMLPEIEPEDYLITP